MRKAFLAFAVAALGLSAGTQAAVYSLSANVSNVYSPDFNTTVQTRSGKGSSNFVELIPAGGMLVYQIDLYVYATGLEAGKRSVGNLAMNINLSAGMTQETTLPGWQADASNTDTNGSAPGGGAALWAISGDQGVPGDLQGIVVSTTIVPAPTTFDFRAKVGIPASPTAFTASIANDVNATGWTDGKTYIGSVYLDTNRGGHIVFNLTGASYQDSSTGALVADQGATLQAATVDIIVDPEPACLSLFGFGGMVLVARRRRA